MQQCGAAGNAAGVGSCPRVDVRSGIDEDGSHLGVAVARRRNQRRFPVIRISFDRSAAFNQHPCDSRDAIRYRWQPESGRVEAQHRHVAERRRAQLVIAPVRELLDRELRMLLQQRA